MQKYLLIDAKPKEGNPVSAYIPDNWFLMLCQAASDTLKCGDKLSAVLLQTTPKDAYPIKEFKDWIEVWNTLAVHQGKDLLEKQAIYFEVAGHRIVKRARYHDPQDTDRDRMRDLIHTGPSKAMEQDDFWKKRRGVIKKETLERIEALDYQLALVQDEMPSGKKGGPRKKEPPKEPPGNSFVAHYAKFSQKALEFERNQLTKPEKLPDHGGDGYYMADADYSGLLPQKIWARYEGASYPDFRVYLEGVMAEAQKKFDAAVVDDLHNLIRKPGNRPSTGVGQEVLPVLASVMLIAEPARQPRTFLNSLLVVDPSQGQLRSYGE